MLTTDEKIATEREGRTHSKVLAKAGLTEVIEHLYFYQHLCLNQADEFQMPCFRQYPKRWHPYWMCHISNLEDEE